MASLKKSKSTLVSYTPAGWWAETWREGLFCGNGKIGAYRDESGTLHLVSARCPHLGCELTWNPDEKSWDCPCHGSRFDYHGNLIDNPAQEDLLRDGASPS